MLRAVDLSYGYGAPSSDRDFHLQDVTIEVARGSLTGLLGPNGCGKTTLLRLMAGILKARSGIVTLNNVPLGTLSRREIARHIAVVPQD